MSEVVINQSYPYEWDDLVQDVHGLVKAVTGSYGDDAKLSLLYDIGK